MKKSRLIATLLVAVLVLTSFTACGGKETEAEGTEQTVKTTASATKEEKPNQSAGEEATENGATAPVDKNEGGNAGAPSTPQDGKVAATVGSYKVTDVMFEYFYAMNYEYCVQTELAYNQQGMSVGFPLDKSPDEVLSKIKDENGKEMYFDDVLKDYALNTAHQQLALYAEAEALGYTLNADEKKQLEEAVGSVKKLAEAEGVSLDAYLKSNYSEQLNEAGLRELFEIELLATRYSVELQTKAYDSVTEGMVEAEYNANKADYLSYEGDSTDVRHCLVMFEDTSATDEEKKKAAYAKAEKAMKEWRAAGATEEAFIKIVEKYNEDTASTPDGGLYSGITASSNYVDNFKNWAVDPARKTGDCEIVETEYGYHLMYFVKNNGPEWKTVVREALQEKAYEEAFTAATSTDGKYKLVKNDDVINELSDNFCKKLKEKLA